MEKLKLLSLCPQETEEYANEVSLLLNKMTTDSEVKNIGVVAQYGAGKSSFIKTLKGECNREHKKFKFLDISLATFNKIEFDEEGNENVNDNCDKNDLNKIEQSILQQMIFRKEKKDTPSSQIKRINNFTNEKFFIWLFLILSCALSIAVFSILILNISGQEIYRFTNWEIWYPIIGSVLFLVFSILLAFNINLYKIAIKGIEIEINEGQESLLNKYIDEIIYYFQKTNYNVVIFEDLDRFNSLKIFVKLRELNLLLNNNEKIKDQKERIIFVYAVKNDIFYEAADRVKFFDLIISLNPALSQLNVRDYLVRYLIESGLGENWLSKSFIRDISFYIKDMRILKSIINDCTLYYNQNFKVVIKEANIDKKVILLDDSEDIKAHEQLFALMTYKNVHPDQFEKMEKGLGELNDLIAETEKYRSYKKNNVIYNNSISYIKTNFDSITNGKKITPLLKAIIKGGFIDDNYKRYIFKRGGTFLSDNDELFSKMLITHEEPIFDLALNDVELILKDMSADKLNYESALNFDLVDYLFETPNVQEDQLSAIKTLLCSNEKIVEDFLKEYFSINGEFHPVFIEFIITNRYDVFDLIEMAEPEEGRKEKFLTLVFEKCSAEAIEKQSNKDFIKSYLKEDGAILTEFEKYQDKITVLKSNGIIIKQLRNYNYSTSLSNEEMDLNNNNICKTLVLKEYASIKYGRGKNKGKANLILKISA